MSNSKMSLDYYKNLPPGPWIEQPRNYGPSLDDIPWMEGDDEEEDAKGIKDLKDPTKLQLNEVTGKMEAQSEAGGVSTSGSISPMPSMVDVAEEHNYVLKMGFKQEDQIGLVPPFGVKTDYEFEENGIESSVNDFGNSKQNQAGAEVIMGEPQTPNDFGFGLVTAAADGLEQQIDLAPFGIQNDLSSYPIVLVLPPLINNTGRGRVSTTPSPTAKRIRIMARGKPSASASAAATTTVTSATATLAIANPNPSINKVATATVPLIIQKREANGQQKPNFVQQKQNTGQQKQTNGKQSQIIGQQKQTSGQQPQIIGLQKQTIGQQNPNLRQQQQSTAQPKQTNGQQPQIIGQPKQTNGQQPQNNNGSGQQKPNIRLRQQQQTGGQSKQAIGHGQQQQTIGQQKQVIGQGQKQQTIGQQISGPGLQIPNTGDAMQPGMPFLLVNYVTEVTTPSFEVTTQVDDAQAQVNIADANANDFKIQPKGKAALATKVMAKPCVSKNISAMMAMEGDIESEAEPFRSPAPAAGAAQAKKNTRPKNPIDWTCYHCEVKFTSYKKLREHISTIPNGHFRCRHCNKMIETHEGWKKHESLHTRTRIRGEPEMCQICKKFFSTRDKLIAHLLDHTDENRFKCDLCPKKFRRESGLKRHKTVHSGEKPSYVCTFCGQSFSSARTRSTHEFTHIAARFGLEQIKRKNKKSKTGN